KLPSVYHKSYTFTNYIGMPTVDGTLTRNSTNRFTAVFDIEGTSMSFTANVTPAVGEYVVNDVKLTYDDADQLTTKRSYHGRIGFGILKLTLKNGPVIDDKLRRTTCWVVDHQWYPGYAWRVYLNDDDKILYINIVTVTVYLYYLRKS
ncbi:hypothetical protein ABKN59_005388, partial [Abortiporus biennis]